MGNKVAVELEMYLHVRDYSGERVLFATDMSEYGYACLGRVTLVGEYEDIDKDPRQAMLEGLERQLDKERADSQSRINLLLERISKLQAIGHEVEA